ncbi:hypothetical protein Sbal183_2471 [Shewanella baltica OS183]|uniref:hypothetical protein n=1 Tax=Shewanella baltica TaxID=62322 RepID=UPI0001E10DEC|nr:hypothetical protein [Shewanella baltica]AEG11104.1 hypothetical protein Sbal175_1833 [Shewanella baltica BA175]EHQ15365.1 hypothetical protein Sbal183_2471 [Shewanella baltica OS183]
MRSKFNYRIDAPISEKKRKYRTAVYCVLFAFFGAASTGFIYILGDIFRFDLDAPIRGGSFSTLEVIGFFGVYLVFMMLLVVLLLQIAKRIFLWLGV